MAPVSDESDLSDVVSDGLEDKMLSSDEQDFNEENSRGGSHLDEEDELSTPTNTPQATRGKPEQPRRETRKRQLTYYEEESADEEEEELELDDDDELDDDEDEYYAESAPSFKRSQRRKVVTNPMADIDEDLILTDEETEYQGETDPAKMTERQRARLAKQEEFMSEDAIEDRMAAKLPQKAEGEKEAALRKAEKNRRRQDYKNKQLEEEKRDTINKLLMRRAVKTREPQQEEEEEGTGDLLKPRRPQFQHPSLFRWVDNADRTVLGCGYE